MLILLVSRHRRAEAMDGKHASTCTRHSLHLSILYLQGMGGANLHLISHCLCRTRPNPSLISHQCHWSDKLSLLTFCSFSPLFQQITHSSEEACDLPTPTRPGPRTKHTFNFVSPEMFPTWSDQTIWLVRFHRLIKRSNLIDRNCSTLEEVCEIFPF